MEARKRAAAGQAITWLQPTPDMPSAWPKTLRLGSRTSTADQPAYLKAAPIKTCGALVQAM